MEKKIFQVGNSWVVSIPRVILSALRINPVIDRIELYIKDDEIRIKKIKKEVEN